MLKARPLKKNSQIGLIAPASPFDVKEFHAGIKFFEQRGYTLKYRKDIFDKQNYLAGSDERRLDELHEMFEDEQISAVLAVRGGYGSLRLLEGLDFEKIAKSQKPLIGFSDITALHAALFSKSALTSFHGSHLISLAKAAKPVQDHFFNILEGVGTQNNLLFPCNDTTCDDIKCLNSGIARGKIFVGNLTVLSHLAQTPYFPNLDQVILAIEDVWEAPYRIDRMLTQFELAGVFDKISGVVAGQFTFEKPNNDFSCAIEEQLKQIAIRHKLPCISNCPFGHIDDNYLLPVGIEVSLDAEKKTLTALESMTLESPTLESPTLES